MIVDNLLQEVFEDLVPWRGPGISAQARDPWTLACQFESENRTLWNCWRIFSKRCRPWNSAARGRAGFCWHLADLLLDSSWGWKRRVFSANLWRANLFFSYLVLCDLCFQFFLCWWGLTSLFDLLFLLIKLLIFILIFHSILSLRIFFLEFECVACFLFRLLIRLL